MGKFTKLPATPSAFLRTSIWRIGVAFLFKPLIKTVNYITTDHVTQGAELYKQIRGCEICWALSDNVPTSPIRYYHIVGSNGVRNVRNERPPLHEAVTRGKTLCAEYALLGQKRE